MAFRHYQGSVPTARKVWSCPSCAAENTGPLEGGCQVCGAGKDARKGPEPVRQPVDLSGVRRVVTAYVEWRKSVTDLPKVLDDALQYAFTAGVEWAQSVQPVPGTPAAAPPAREEASAVQGGFLVALVDPLTHDPTLADTPTQQTVLAALAFYRDNQLAYGAVPGQLSAQEVTQLIERLTPQESEA